MAEHAIPLATIRARPFRNARHRASWRSPVIAVTWLAAGVTGADARVQSSPALGVVEFPVSCSAAAQPEFERAVALLHHMTYPQAHEAFQHVARTDPRCAMAQWGIAMTLFQPLWPTRPGPDDLRRGWQAAQAGRALNPPTERERLYIASVEAFFAEPSASDYWQRIRRWEHALAQLFEAYPDDVEAASFYALALLATAPADTSSHDHAERAAALLHTVYNRNPEHPGAMHYLIHANDAPGRERESLDVVRRYDTVAPRNPHALHMPTHIYTRLGEWDAVIDGNVRAAAAALEHPAGDNGEFVWDEFPHAIEYLVYAWLQKGDDEQAAGQLKRLQETARLQPSFKTAFHAASIPARYALERRAWAEAASLAAREPATLDWERFPWPEAVTWFARGTGAARTGRSGDARTAAARLQALEARASEMGEALFTRQIRVLRLEVEAWVAQADGRAETGRTLMRQAAELEASTPKHAVTPAPTLPALEQLGDLLLEQGLAGDALAAYTQSLEQYPRRFNGLLGAARAARALGDEARARAFYRQLLDVAGRGTRDTLEEARRSVAGEPLDLTRGRNGPNPQARSGFSAIARGPA